MLIPSSRMRSSTASGTLLSSKWRGFHAQGSGAEGRATVATGPVFAVGDVEVDDLLVGDGTDLTVKNILALTQLATSGAWGRALESQNSAHASSFTRGPFFSRSIGRSLDRSGRSPGAVWSRPEPRSEGLREAGS